MTNICRVRGDFNAIIVTVYIILQYVQYAHPLPYAPYASVKAVTTCTLDNSDGSQSTWTCSGAAMGGFAAISDVNQYNSVTDMCDTYCDTPYNTVWKVITPGNTSPITFVGGQPATIIHPSCVPIRTPFKCSDRVNPDVPINVPSIELYAVADAKEYYFSPFSNATCAPSVQCSAFRILKTIILPGTGVADPVDVSNIRGTGYSCLLAYMGASNLVGTEICFNQLGPRCFEPGMRGSQFCITNDVVLNGLTSGGASPFMPSLFCSINNGFKLRSLAYVMDMSSPPPGLGFCTAVILEPETASYAGDTPNVWFPTDVVTGMARRNKIILKLPFSCSMRGANALRSIKGVMISSNSFGVLLDMSGTMDCPLAADVSDTVMTIKNSLAGVGVFFVGIKMPLVPDPKIPIASLVSSINMVVASTDLITSSWSNTAPILCQTSYGDLVSPYSGQGVISVIKDFVTAIPRNKLVLATSLRGNVMKYGSAGSAAAVTVGGSEVPNKILSADAESLIAHCNPSADSCCAIDQLSVLTALNSIETCSLSIMRPVDLQNMIETVYGTFGVNQFLFTHADADYKLGREYMPTLAHVHKIITGLVGYSGSMTTATRFNTRASNTVAHAPSGSIVAPRYSIGNGPVVDCPGVVAAVGDVVMSNVEYTEFYKCTAFDGLYAAKISSLNSCTPGRNIGYLPRSDVVITDGVDANTLLPLSSPSQFGVGFPPGSTELKEYVPPVGGVCVDVNTSPIDRLPFYEVDDEYVFNEPTLSTDGKLFWIPVGTYYIISNFSFGVDYINFNSSCVSYDTEALPSCAVTVCGGDLSCINTYGGVCGQANVVMNDIRRSGMLIRQAFDDLAVEEEKAKVYEDVVPVQRSGTDTMIARPKPRLIGAIIAATVAIAGIAVGIGLGAAALDLAKKTAKRVDRLEQQLDLTQNAVIELSNTLVTVTNKLNANLELTNNRIDKMQDQINDNFQLVNQNFRDLASDLRSFQSEVNDRFKVSFGYQSWYTYMMSINTQMLQAAMQMKYKTNGVRMCMMSIQEGMMGPCPSGLNIFKDYPGLSYYPTIASMLYQDRKLFIVNRIPNNVEPIYMNKVVGAPTLSGGIPCWPDYDVWSYNGEYYKDIDCHNNFCSDNMTVHDEFKRCLVNPSECKVYCGTCFKDICYEGEGQYKFSRNDVVVDIPASPPPVFERPNLNDFEIPQINQSFVEDQIFIYLNTSVVMQNITGDLAALQEFMDRYQDEYDRITAQRDLGNKIDLGLLIGIIVAFVLILVIIIVMLVCFQKQKASLVKLTAGELGFANAGVAAAAATTAPAAVPSIPPAFIPMAQTMYDDRRNGRRRPPPRGQRTRPSLYNYDYSDVSQY